MVNRTLFSARAMIGLVAVVVAGCASSGEVWSRHLVGKLKCGMTIGEVSDLVQPTRSVVPYKHAWLGDLMIEKGRSTVWISMGPRGVDAFRIATDEILPLKSVRLSPRTNLCTGESTLMLEILTKREFIGASVLLDGKQTAEIDGLMFARLEIPLGEHEIRIEKEGLVPFVRHLSYSGTDRGDQRLDLSGRN